jgi:alpha-beta hydrolase superfamily lysophospholipase
MEKIFIKNRKGENISVLIEKSSNAKGLVFIMHGLGGFKEQDHIATFADAFKEKEFTVVRFDTTNTLGESGGKYENATITNYYEDLEDVIKWAQEQEWYQEPFALSGHSLGGICSALYAEKYPRKVLALAPISTVVSGKLSVEAHKRDDAEDFAKWEKTGWKEEESQSKPGIMKRLPWSHIADRLKYDLLPDASKLTMPVLLITGENDTSTPPDHIQILFEALPGPKECHIIKNAPHTFRDEEHLAEIKDLFLKWIDKHLLKADK